MTYTLDQSMLALEWDAAKTIARLFHYLDTGDYDAVSGLFAHDGVWVRLGQDLVGPAAVRAAMAARPATLVTRHLVTNLLMEADADGVDAHYSITVFDDPAASGGPAVLSLPGAIFACEDRLVQTAAGLRFAARRPRAVFKRP